MLRADKLHNYDIITFFHLVTTNSTEFSIFVLGKLFLLVHGVWCIWGCTKLHCTGPLRPAKMMFGLHSCFWVRHSLSMCRQELSGVLNLDSSTQTLRRCSTSVHLDYFPWHVSTSCLWKLLADLIRGFIGAGLLKANSSIWSILLLPLQTLSN